MTKRICLGLQRRDRDLVLHGRETGRIVRTADGEFIEVHEPLDEHERWVLVQHDTPRCCELRGRGRRATVSPHGHLRRSACGPRSRASTSRTASTPSLRPSWPPPTTTVEHEALHEAAPVWDRELHGGADERPDTDAYARRHEHEHATEGALREADPEAETTSTH